MSAENLVNVVSYRADYTAVLPEARALLLSEIVCPKTNPDYAAGGILPLLGNLQELRPRVLRLPEYDIRAYDQLGIRTRALSFAESQYLMATRTPVGLVKKVAELARVKKRLRAECAVLILSGCISPAALDPLKFNCTRRKMARNVKELAMYLHQHWPAIAEHTRFSSGELEDIITLAEDVDHALLLFGPDSSKLSEPADIRMRMFTLVLRSVAEVEGAVAYLFRHEPAQLKRYMPNCYPFQATRTQKPRSV